MSIDLEAIRAMYEDYIKYECGIHGGTGTNLLYCDGTRAGHDEFAEWIIDGFPALIAEVERLNAENERLKLQRPIEVDENTVALACECSQLKQQLATVTAERDAAVEDLTLSNTRKFNNPCEFCKKSGKNCAPVDMQDVCKAWEWRGERSGENG